MWSRTVSPLVLTLFSLGLLSAATTDITVGTNVKVQVPAVTRAALLDTQYKLTVPEGWAAVTFDLTADTQDLLYLYVRYGAPVTLDASGVNADFGSQDQSLFQEVVVSLATRPVLRPGDYYIAIARLTTGSATTATLAANFVRNVPTPGTALVPNTQLSFILPAASVPVLLNGSNGFRVDVPPGMSKMEITLQDFPAALPVDFYARYNLDVDVDSSSNPITDYYGDVTDTGRRIVATADAGSTLKAGTYFIGFVVRPNSTGAKALLSATLTPASLGTALTSGVEQSFDYDPIFASTIFNTASSFYIQVPPEATKLEVALTSTTANADMDLYVNRGALVYGVNSTVSADHVAFSPNASETITITRDSNPPLRPGFYSIVPASATLGVRLKGTVKATITQ